jgi:hypothetical protein
MTGIRAHLQCVSGRWPSTPCRLGRFRLIRPEVPAAREWALPPLASRAVSASTASTLLPNSRWCSSHAPECGNYRRACFGFATDWPTDGFFRLSYRSQAHGHWTGPLLNGVAGLGDGVGGWDGQRVGAGGRRESTPRTRARLNPRRTGTSFNEPTRYSLRWPLDYASIPCRRYRRGPSSRAKPIGEAGPRARHG